MSFVQRGIFQNTYVFAAFFALMIPPSSLAKTSAFEGVEITPFIGQMFGSKLDSYNDANNNISNNTGNNTDNNTNNNSKLTLDSDSNFGIAFA